MVCLECGKHNNDGAKFCKYCGSDQLLFENKEMNAAYSTEFYGTKYWAKVELWRMETSIDISNNQMKMAQKKTNFYHFKKDPIETVHDTSTFTSVELKSRVDMFDWILIGILASTGFINPLLFLLAFGSFFALRNYELCIYKNNGATIRIPCDSKTESKEFISKLPTWNRSIVI